MRAFVLLAERRQLRRRGHSRRAPATCFVHVNPNVSVILDARIVPRKNPFHFQFVLAGQRRNLHALSAAPIKSPPVITALQILPVKSPVRKRYPPVRTSIPHRKRRALIRPPQYQRHLQQHRLDQPPAPYFHAPRRWIPKFPQKSRVTRAFRLLRRLQIVHEIFFGRHLKSFPADPASLGALSVASSYSNQPRVDLQEPRLGDILVGSSHEILDFLLPLPSPAGQFRRLVALFPTHYSLLAAYASRNKALKGFKKWQHSRSLKSSISLAIAMTK